MGTEELELEQEPEVAEGALTAAAPQDEGASGCADEGEVAPGSEATRAEPVRRRRSVAELARNLLIKLAVIALTVWATLAFVVSVTVHYGNSMHPAFEDGDLVVALRLQRPYIDSAVVYEHEGEKRVGRVVALADNDVDITAVGELRVNKVVPAEEVFYPTYEAEGSNVDYPYHVGEGQAFVLNDFRSDTDDSRSFGAVRMEDIDGPVIFSMRIRGF